MTTDKDDVKNEGDSVGPADVNGGPWKCGAFYGATYAALGGILVFLVLQLFHPVFDDPEQANAFGVYPPEVQDKFDRQNAIFVVAILGGLIAAGLAVAEGLARKSWITAAVAGLACAAVAGGFGALAGYLGNMFLKSKTNVTDLSAALQVHGAMFALMGGGIGLAAAIFLGRNKSTAVNCVIGGVLAGILAGLAYPVLGALVIDTKALLPYGGVARFIWCAVTGAIIGGLIPSLANKTPKKTK